VVGGAVVRSQHHMVEEAAADAAGLCWSGRVASALLAPANQTFACPAPIRAPG
jgi:hypothetical protein